MRRKTLLALTWGTIAYSSSMIAAPIAQAKGAIDLAVFRQGICANGVAGVSNREISLEGPTIPSLWWTRDVLISKTPQFNPKLIEAWLVCDAGQQIGDARVCSLSASRPGRVEMLVNTQLWSVMDYLSRYEMINRFGTATSECGFNLYIYNAEAKLLADYTCDFNQSNATKSAPCQLRVDVSGKGGLRRGPTDVFSGTGNSTALP
jgi:hypothetical protein